MHDGDDGARKGLRRPRQIVRVEEGLHGLQLLHPPGAVIVDIVVVVVKAEGLELGDGVEVVGPTLVRLSGREERDEVLYISRDLLINNNNNINCSCNMYLLDYLHRDSDHAVILSNAFLIDTVQQKEN